MDIDKIVNEILSENENTIAIGSDHGGFPFKKPVISHLKNLNFKVIDVGTYSNEAVNYPDYAHKVALEVSKGNAIFGIMIDGAGVGSAIVCNKVKGIRAAHCSNTFEAFNARAHNNANVLTLGSRVIGIELAKFIVTKFLTTDFEGGRHLNRVNLITKIENSNFR
jgi:ribose 5-phosphate isomerase B